VSTAGRNDRRAIVGTASVEPFAPLDTTYNTVAMVRAPNPLANYTLLGLGVAAAVIGLSIGSTLAG
jgi:inner membrane protein